MIVDVIAEGVSEGDFPSMSIPNLLRWPCSILIEMAGLPAASLVGS
jgi:hypothetical protein